MEKMERRHILIEFASTLTFVLGRCLHLWVQSIKWRLDGTQRRLKEAEDPENYDHCAQLMTVWRKHAFDPYVLHNTPGNFMLQHSDFVHPHYVLKDEVSFYCLTEKEAIFVEAPPGVEVWQNKVDPFHKHGQFEYALRVIKMPLYAFHCLADELGPISEKLIFVDFIPRSGSTLMCKMFEEMGCVSYSEPHALNDVLCTTMKDNSPETTKKNIAAQVRFLCKPRSQPTPAFMFKLLPSILQSKVMGTYLHELYPNATFLFLYRNGAPMAKSLTRLMAQVNALRLINILRRPLPSLWKKIRVLFAAVGQELDTTVMDILNKTEHIEYLTCGLYWALAVQAHMKDPKPRAAMKYEDIVNCPEASIQAILKQCDLPEDLLSKALRAFDGDSQHGMAMSWEELVKKKWSAGDTFSKNRVAKQEMDLICHNLGVPDLSEDCVLPNTITVSLMDNNNYM